LDEVFLKINGVQHYLWRAVDQQGTVIDILVQPKRDRFAASGLSWGKGYQWRSCWAIEAL
jgi:transposase-like protein